MLFGLNLAELVIGLLHGSLTHGFVYTFGPVVDMYSCVLGKDADACFGVLDADACFGVVDTRIVCSVHMPATVHDT